MISENQNNFNSAGNEAKEIQRSGRRGFLAKTGKLAYLTPILTLLPFSANADLPPPPPGGSNIESG